jgi:threonine-phosphate decarboxylase
MANVEAYPLHGGQLKQIAERFGIPVTQLLDFSANINPAGPPPAVATTLRESLEDPAALIEYPDLQLTELKRSIADYAGIGTQNLNVSNGFVPLLEVALRMLPIRRCLVPVPAFVEYRKALERGRVETVPHPLSPDSDFKYDCDAMLGTPVDAILLANPQNPSGVSCNAASMRELVARAAKRKRYVLLDEAFVDYVPERSLTRDINEFHNLIVFRSVTKFHGIPGLRVAYAAACSALSTLIGDNLPPWPVTTLAARAVIAALGDRAYADRSITENIERRTLLERDLEGLGLCIYPSSANFILFRLPTEIDAEDVWRRMILDHGIVLRVCTNYEGLQDRHLRASVRTPGENERLVKALADVLAIARLHGNHA